MSRRLTGTVLGAAALITVLTVLARLTGFARNWVFARTVGQTDLNGTYMTVNMVPNILYEIVAGGALASLVVPLLARAVADGDRRHVDRTASALLTWTVLALTPVAVVVALAAEPIASFMLRADGGASPESVAVGASMLRVFAPQVVLYGVGVVLTGVLQAHRKFGGPAFAPLLSSVVVIGAYVTYAVVAPRGTDLDTLTTGQELILSVGTTLGVVALSLSLLVPLRGIGLRLRPALRFPAGVARQVRALAYAGVSALLAQQISVVVALLLSNDVSQVTTAVYFQAQTLYLLPWAVLAVPVATTVFPRLSEAWSGGDRQTYQRQLAAATGVIVVLSCGAAAMLVAAARPLARVMVQGAPGIDSVDALTRGVVGFAAGLLGYGLFALLSRALYAAGQMLTAAVACVTGWLAVVAADLVLVRVLDDADRVLALAVGNSIGMTVLGCGLLWAVLRAAGTKALAGFGAIATASVGGAVVAGAAGWSLEGLLDGGGVWAALWQGLVVAVVTGLVFAAVLAVSVRGRVIAALQPMWGDREG